ncbi:hypothetical protein [Streptosporangium saharense]|uniref:Uncharacterized protein n=1 Tax=Streptosporangium saharense TaxID=1706840 RepID=A0A7W7VLS2_9ACTN|nr:hypothetical protein [Streptosporangium saharense]MBB4915061.1 hypothetical protein [Streptosporangium saharense]
MATRGSGSSLPLEAVLIRTLRERPSALARKMSLATALERLAEVSDDGVGFSDGTWRNIEHGRKIADDWELVLMALVVGATPAQLKEVGRQSAAELLSREINKRAEVELTTADLDLDDIPDETKQKLLRQLAEISRLPGATEQDRAEMRAVLFGQLNTLLDLHAAQLRLMRAK